MIRRVTLPTDDANKPAVLVTGAARRIGRAIVRELHSAGANLAVHHRGSASEAASLVDDLNAARPGSAVSIKADLREPEAPSRLVARTVAAFGRLDVLVNNASAFYPTPLGGLDSGQWNDLMETNLRAPLWLAKEASTQLINNGGAIVNIADIYADRPLRDHAVYCAAKAGLVMLTRCLAVDLAPRVRVNAIAPGAILWPEQGTAGAHAEGVLARTALQRLGKVEDIARVVRYLVFDADYTTGQVLTVDGGRLL